MHNRLEEYLNEIAERLGPLPVTRRNEELKEMRQHLQNAVIVNREFGQSEEEATVSAVEQFGMPQESADHLVGVWRRGEAIENKRSFWGAAASTLALLFLQHEVDHFVAFYTGFSRSLWPLGLWSYLIIVPWCLCLMILPGWIVAKFFRKRAVQGAALAVIICNGIQAIRFIAGHQVFLPSMFVVAVIYSLITVLSTCGAVRLHDQTIKKVKIARLIHRA